MSLLLIRPYFQIPKTEGLIGLLPLMLIRQVGHGVFLLVGEVPVGRKNLISIMFGPCEAGNDSRIYPLGKSLQKDAKLRNYGKLKA
jgi:hypothetical protein